MGSTFGETVRRLRKERGWTQEELAERLGTSKQVISRYEKSQRSPKITIAAEYARVFGVSLSDLTGEDEPEQKEPAIINYHIIEALHQNPKLGLLFDRTSKMTQKDIDFMLDVAERITKEVDGD